MVFKVSKIDQYATSNYDIKLGFISKITLKESEFSSISLAKESLSSGSMS